MIVYMERCNWFSSIVFVVIPLVLGCNARSAMGDNKSAVSLDEVGRSGCPFVSVFKDIVADRKYIGPCIETRDANDDGEIDSKTLYVYNVDGKILKKETISRKGCSMESEYMYRYNRNGNLLEESFIEGETHGRTTHFYKNGITTRTESEMASQGQSRNTETRIIDVNGNAVRIERLYENGTKNVEEYVYDEHGNWTEKRIDAPRQGVANRCTYIKKTYVYDERGNVINEETDNYGDGTVENRVAREFDSENNLLNETRDNGSNETVSSYFRYIYDGEGRRKAEVQNEIVTKEWAYDEKGNVICETCYNSNKEISYRSEMIYDSHGNIVQKTVLTTRGDNWPPEKSTVKYYYDCWQ